MTVFFWEKQEIEPAFATFSEHFLGFTLFSFKVIRFIYLFIVMALKLIIFICIFICLDKQLKKFPNTLTFKQNLK